MYLHADNIDEYIELSYDSELLRKVIQIISSCFPKESPRYFDNGRTFSGIAFGKNPIPTADYEEAGLINIASQKSNISIYFYQFVNGENVFDDYVSRFPKSSVGKGCLRIKNVDFLEKHNEALASAIQSLDK
ncbi:DUF1801 domain-containing protein [Enterococcus entomosocium]|uniref:DUF1801 domain-containing protein n=1 Tax=Enterococcus TaxID=1350 RepID=UPI001FD1E603|nr:DUF1801 domain-containing protein [Enterococcus casseliflavus]